MLKLINRINSLLTASERKEAIAVLWVTIVMAFLETIGIVSILPFMTVLSSPEVIETNRYLKWGYDAFGFSKATDYLIFLGLIVLGMLILSNAVRAYARWKTLDFSIMTGHTISSRLLRQYLFQPYAYYLTHNSALLAKNVLDEVTKLVTNVIVPFADAIARIITIVAIVGLLLLIDPVLAVCSTLILGGAFAAVYWSMRRWLQHIGHERLESQGKRYQIVDEAFSGIKNIKLTGNEYLYARLYEAPSKIFSRTSAMSGVAGEIPKYAIEVIAFGGILFIILYLLAQQEGLTSVLPLISLYAFVGYRVMPGFQAVFQSYTRIRFHTAVLDEIQEEMTATATAKLSDSATTSMPAMTFNNVIEFENVSFKYDVARKPAIQNISFTIPCGSSVGIIGKTGTGKTTIVDLLLGLLQAQAGNVKVDGQKLDDENIRAWQKNCAYVTQNIYLIDDTIRANIAFGVAETDIDDHKLRDAARMAALDDFIESELPDSYNTIVGENGIRLSGGQRQRIGLARALYLDRPVLVLDEATSALDITTEEKIIASIQSLSAEKTIIIIAHRPATIDHCDHIIDMNSKQNYPNERNAAISARL